jgi:hypothetical protein
MSNPFIKRTTRSKTAHGNLSEKRVAKRLGYRQTPASGALDHAKGDFKSKDFLGEAKATTKESISLKLAWLRKNESHALLIGRKPVLVLSFVRPSGAGVAGGTSDYVVLPLGVFEEITGASTATRRMV